MISIRTDLALEATEICEEQSTALDGVVAVSYTHLIGGIYVNNRRKRKY